MTFSRALKGARLIIHSNFEGLSMHINLRSTLLARASREVLRQSCKPLPRAGNDLKRRLSLLSALTWRRSLRWLDSIPCLSTTLSTLDTLAIAGFIYFTLQARREPLPTQVARVITIQESGANLQGRDTSNFGHRRRLCVIIGLTHPLPSAIQVTHGMQQGLTTLTTAN